MDSDTAGQPPTPPARPSSALAWLLTVIVIGLALLSGTFVLVLDLQRSDLQARQAQFVRRYPLREAESKRLTATTATTEAELQRLADVYREGKANLDQLTEIRAKREPLVNQSTDMQVKVESLMMDLLILAKSDRDAQMIIAKYHIHQDTPTSAPIIGSGDKVP